MTTSADEPGSNPITAGADDGRRGRADQQAIFETIRRRISTCVYPPGSVIKENRLAEEFGVSRTPIRQVLQRLEYAGLVQPMVGHGTVVTSLDLPQMREILRFRVELARILPGFLDLTDVDATLTRFADLRARQKRLEEFHDPLEFADISHEIRDCIHRHVANRYMAETLRTSYFQASRLWFGVLPTAIARFVDLQSHEIDTIAAAFATRDPKAIGDAVHAMMVAWADAIADAMRPT